MKAENTGCNSKYDLSEYENRSCTLNTEVDVQFCAKV